MSSKTHISNLQLNSVNILVKLEWNGEQMDAVLMNYERQLAWQGKVSQSVLEQFSAALEMRLEDYIQELYQACSAKCQEQYSATYQENLFILKKHHDGIAIKLAQIRVEESNFSDILPSVMKYLLTDNAHLSSEVTRLQSENKQLCDARDRLLKRMEETANIKTQVESQLYAQFLEVLNAKKQKIVELMTEREPEVTRKANEDTPTNSRKSPSPSRMSTSSGDGAYDEDTDVETDDEASSKRSRRR